jgi:tetratricopeptide (TPR) repeat protein
MSLRPATTVAVLLTLCAATLAGAQDWKGTGRMEGRVLGPDGTPIVGAKLGFDLPERGGGGPKAVSDKKGKWAVGGITSGAWNLDVEAEGFTTRKVQVTLATEATRLQPLDIKLDKAAPAGPPPDVLAAISKGDEAYKAGRWAEARTEYEKLLALRPDLSRTIHEQLARVYSQEGNTAKVLEHLQFVLDAEPGNTAVKLLMAQEALKGGQLERGMALLAGVDEASIKDPDVYFNVAVLLLNQQKPEDAITYLTKSVKLDPAYVDGYFQRGLAYLGQGKMAEAKADFNKVIELAPAGPQADTARKALLQIK